MSKIDKISDEGLRMSAVSVLQRRGYHVSNVAHGQGVPKFSRLEITRGKEKNSCSLKTTNGGRISYTRNSDGTYKVLSEVDLVIHIWQLPGLTGKVRISAFKRDTILNAFEANHLAKLKRGMEHIPSWVNPENEDGWRLAGSGFQKDAIWVENVELNGYSAIDISEETLRALPDSGALPTERGIMDRIKLMLSDHLGINPEKIEIDVRIKP